MATPKREFRSKENAEACLRYWPNCQIGVTYRLPIGGCYLKDRIPIYTIEETLGKLRTLRINGKLE